MCIHYICGMLWGFLSNSRLVTELPTHVVWRKIYWNTSQIVTCVWKFASFADMISWNSMSSLILYIFLANLQLLPLFINHNFIQITFTLISLHFFLHIEHKLNKQASSLLYFSLYIIYDTSSMVYYWW